MKIIVILNEDSKTAASIVVEDRALVPKVFDESFREPLRSLLAETKEKALPLRREVREDSKASYSVTDVGPGDEGYEEALLTVFRGRGYAAALVPLEYQEALPVLAGDTYSRADRELFWSRVANL